MHSTPNPSRIRFTGPLTPFAPGLVDEPVRLGYPVSTAMITPTIGTAIPPHQHFSPQHRHNPEVAISFILLSYRTVSVGGHHASCCAHVFDGGCEGRVTVAVRAAPRCRASCSRSSWFSLRSRVISSRWVWTCWRSESVEARSAGGRTPGRPVVASRSGRSPGGAWVGGRARNGTLRPSRRHG